MKRHLILLLFTGLFFCANAQSISLTFEVNMSYQVQLGDFDPSAEFVDVAGSFNGWGESLAIMDDADGDLIYTVTLPGFSVGSTFEFKFRQNGIWDGTEEFPGTGNNRVYTILPNDNDLYFWYNNELSPDGPPQAGFIATAREVYNGAVIQFENTSGGNVEEVEWLFEGAAPSSTDLFNPKAVYYTPGIYDVTLIARNANAADTLTLQDYITVKDRGNTSVLPWWNETVFYEIFVRSFYDSDGDGIGDFNGLTQKLDYLNDGNPETDDDLGITGIWLMPIHDSPSYHGYDVVDYRSIHPDYGTMEDFENFLAAAHDRGIKVIIDYVMNHSSNQHPWFLDAISGPDAEKRDWYRWSATNPNITGPWGQTVWHNTPTGYYYGLFWGGMPDLNYENEAVKAEMFDAADFWLSEVGVDGFRLDAVKYMFENGNQLENTEETYQLWQDFRTFYKSANPDAFAVGEAWTSTAQVVPYVEEERLDYCFEFDLAGTILGMVNTGGNVEPLRQKIQEVYNVYPHLQWGSFLTNHDQDRVKDALGNNLAKNRTAAAIYLTLPGVPYLYYGEEIGMNGTKPDPNIRRPMQWTSGANAGFSPTTPWHPLNGNYSSYNVADMQAEETSLWHWYQKLIKVRNGEPALQTGDYTSLITNKPEVLCFLRRNDSGFVVVMINNSDQPQQDIFVEAEFDGLPGDLTYLFQDLLDESNNIPSMYVSYDGAFGGIDLEARGVRIFKLDNSNHSTATENDVAVQVFPNPTKDRLSIIAPEAAAPEGYLLLDTKGQVVQQGRWSKVGANSSIDVDQLVPGVYFLRLIGKKTFSTVKVIKQ
jgi:alpha-amylase